MRKVCEVRDEGGSGGDAPYLLEVMGVPSEASKGGLGKKRAAKGPFQLLQQVAAFRDRGPIAYGRGQPQRCSAAARLHTVFRGHVCV